MHLWQLCQGLALKAIWGYNTTPPPSPVPNLYKETSTPGLVLWMWGLVIIISYIIYKVSTPCIEVIVGTPCILVIVGHPGLYLVWGHPVL